MVGLRSSTGGIAAPPFSKGAYEWDQVLTHLTDTKLQFRDTGIFLHSSADGKLKISADGTGTDDIILADAVTFSRGFHVTAQSITTSALLDADASYFEINPTGAILNCRITAPVAGRFLVITQTSNGGTSNVSLTSGTWDGTNGTATFNAASETIVAFGVSATRFVIVENVGSVALG